MEVTVTIGGRGYAIDLTRPMDISIPFTFDDAQLSVFGTPPATRAVVAAGSFVGDVRQGGSCNCETYTITPHGNGTHTECIGHVTSARLYVTDALREAFIPAVLVTVTPEKSTERYIPQPAADDVMITRAALVRCLAPHDRNFFDAVIIRTAPNPPAKRGRAYGAVMPPYLSHDAMRYLADEVGARHVLIDTPSVDRLDDGGMLGNHRIFWGMAPGATVAAASPRTITELIFVPDDIEDGAYVLNLQVAPFHADAAPSRPLLYKV